MQLMEIKRTLQINLSTREKYDEETVLRDMQLLWCAYFIQRVTCAWLRAELRHYISFLLGDPAPI